MTDENFTWYHDNVDHVPMHPHNDWIVDRCADHCDDQLPLFSRVGRGLQGNGYIVEKAIDNESQTVLVGSLIDPRTGEKTEQWRTGNINGGRLHYTKNINPATNPQTFTLTFTLDRPDDPNRGWTFTTPAIPYVWTDEPNTYVSSLFVKAVGDPDWDEVPEALMTPHSIDESLAKIEKLIYPEAILDRDELHAPQPGDPNTVNLTYGLGGDINVPNLDNLARILGVNPNSLKDLANNGEDATRYPSFGTGRNAKEYIEWHLHQDLGGGDNLPDVSEDSLKPLKGDGGTKTVWDWIEWARDQAIEQAVEQAVEAAETHLHQDLYGGKTGAHSDWTDIPADLRDLVGDAGDTTVWDWIKYWIGTIANPEQKSKTVSSVTIGGEAKSLYLCSMIPTALVKGKAITPLAMIRADVIVEYFDVLPNVTISIDIKNENVVDGANHKTYCSQKGLQLGTAEIAVMCYKSGESYYPLDVRDIQLSDRAIGSSLSYPGSDPEVQANTGFGWMGNLIDGVIKRQDPFGPEGQYIPVYPNTYGLKYPFSIDKTDGTKMWTECFGPWQIYSGLGNIGGSDKRWQKNFASSPTFLYIFNRSTGALGTRVLLDYNRAYQVSYIQRKVNS